MHLEEILISSLVHLVNQLKLFDGTMRALFFIIRNYRYLVNVFNLLIITSTTGVMYNHIYKKSR